MGDYVSLWVQNVSTITAGIIIAFVFNWILALIVLALLPLLGLEAYAKAKFQQGFSADAKVCLISNYKKKKKKENPVTYVNLRHLSFDTGDV